MNQLDWNLLRAFQATAETGSLSAAARSLGLTQPTLSRQIAALEDRLGLLLFERVGRGLEITAAGRELKTHVDDMGLAAHRVELAARGQNSDLSGWVRITVSDVLAVHLMADVIAKVRAVAPQLCIDVVATNDISDLMRREADIAIRHVRPTDPDLVARLLQDGRAYFYGATAMLDRVGRPDTLADLAQHDWVSFGQVPAMIDYVAPMGIPVTEDAFRVGSASGLVAWHLARAGYGLCAMYSLVGDAAPEMERVLPDTATIDVPIWLVAHREVQTSPKIRLVFDLLAETFSL